MNKSSSVISESETDHLYGSEITIGDIFTRLWIKRGLIVFLPLIFAAVAIAGLLFTKTLRIEKVSYYLDLTGLNKGAYPNGTAFSPQDLLNPQVIAVMAEKFGIKDQNIINEVVSVSFGTPAAAVVDAQYRAEISKAPRNMAITEIRELNDQYTERLRDLSQKGLRISVNYAALGLDKVAGSEFALELPKTWNEVFANRFQIFQNPSITKLSVPNEKEENLNTPEGALAVDTRLDEMQRGVTSVLEDNRFRAVNGLNGATPSNLLASLSDFQNIYFNPIYGAVFASRESSARIYQRDVQLQVEEIDINIEELNRTIKEIASMQTTETDTASTLTGNSRDSNNSQIQFDSSALNQLIDMSRQASLSSYLQEIFNSRIELTKKRAVLKKKLAKMGVGETEAIATNLLVDQQFIDRAQLFYNRLCLDYADLITTVQNIAKAETPNLYKIATSPLGDQKLIEIRDVIVLALSLILGGVIAVVVALLPAKNPQKA